MSHLDAVREVVEKIDPRLVDWYTRWAKVIPSRQDVQFYVDNLRAYLSIILDIAREYGVTPRIPDDIDFENPVDVVKKAFRLIATGFSEDDPSKWLAGLLLLAPIAAAAHVLGYWYVWWGDLDTFVETMVYSVVAAQEIWCGDHCEREDAMEMLLWSGFKPVLPFLRQLMAAYMLLKLEYPDARWLGTSPENNCGLVIIGDNATVELCPDQENLERNEIYVIISGPWGYTERIISVDTNILEPYQVPTRRRLLEA